MKKIIFSLILCMVIFQYCTSTKKTTTTTNTPTPAHMTYAANIQSLITAHCSPCHIPPKGFKKALDTYDAAKGNIDDMVTRIKLNPTERGFMPFKHDKLSDSVINVFVQWKADGLLEK